MGLLWCLCVGAAEVLPPKPKRHFNDYAHVVPVNSAAKLDKQLSDFEQATSSQIVVAIFPKLQTDSSLEDYTHRLATAWEVGQKNKNNGAVLFVFVQDRRVRIEVGYGLEGALPDAVCKRIIAEQIAPKFRNNDYQGGLESAINSLIAATKGEYRGTRTFSSSPRGAAPLLGSPIFWFFVLLVLMILLRRLTRSRGRFYNSSGWYDSGWRSGGNRSSWGGGGFSGGGGSFGGGGASGNW